VTDAEAEDGPYSPPYERLYDELMPDSTAEMLEIAKELDRADELGMADELGEAETLNGDNEFGEAEELIEQPAYLVPLAPVNVVVGV
jgi:hypothetical protein